ncbi:DEAD/DEAH box helicase family protein [Glycomyces tenuis]|uniref:DEAD/DEAH box helicase family protein n=1 Tax=Glycomyces tenuis TaxID=58116 RepID=UPI00041A2743|nr:DEAD/DEAH box helicase family protein [Glycomyces tenuis]
MASNFDFLRPVRPDWFEQAARAERYAFGDPRASCFYARHTLELLVTWLYEVEPHLELPYRSELGAKIGESDFKNLVGGEVWPKMDAIRRIGNYAVHRPAPPQDRDSMHLVKELWHVMFWATRRYSRRGVELAENPPRFDHSLIERPLPEGERKKRQAEIQKMADDHARQAEALEQARRENTEIREAYEAELAGLRRRIAEEKAAAATVPDSHDYDEGETRAYLIDVLLKESGWVHGENLDVEVPVEGMPNTSGRGEVDYVLRARNGIPLAVVEAKRTSKDPELGRQQAVYYANCLQRQYGQRPIIFYTNGYKTWLWDDGPKFYPPRLVAGFYTPDELESLLQRRAARLSLPQTGVNPKIAGRRYQKRAIAAVGHAFEDQHQRHALLVMATGTGKTRTTIALVDQLMRAGWVKRALFLADRKALVKQAAEAFTEHFPDSAPVNLLKDKNEKGRMFFSTYNTMSNLVENRGDDTQHRFGPGYFDLVIVDEAHRSIYQKYGALFDHFDSLLLGLTATPKDEIDRNTYRRFQLEDGMPTDVYDLQEAVDEAWLVPPRAIQVPLRFPRSGLRYDDLSEEDKELWDAAEWDSEGNVPDFVEADAVNKYLMNADTIDKALEVLMEYGLKVDGGERIGKTIVFARNELHAREIVKRFDVRYPQYAGQTARVITYSEPYAEQLIDDFSDPDNPLDVAVSVDMLDTGIDVPEVANLLLFKPIRSKTKFWQMIGRGTRLRKDLFGPGRDKTEFLVFDVCGNLDFFNQNMPSSEGRVAPSLSEQLFRHRAELVFELDHNDHDTPAVDGANVDPEQTTSALREASARRLHDEVAGMNRDNFRVRPHLEQVEHFAEFSAWEPPLTSESYGNAVDLAGLPTAYKPDEDTSPEAKRFDLLALRLQLAVLQHDPSFDRLRDRAATTARLLLDQTTIPMVAEQAVFLEELAGDEWWVDVTVPLLERMRRRIRGLVRFIEKTRRNPVYTDFEDTLGEVSEASLIGASSTVDHKNFHIKIRSYLRNRTDQETVDKLYRNQPVTAVELELLERIFIELGMATAEDLSWAAEQHSGLGLYLRTIVGMDPDSVRKTLDDFCRNRDLTRPQHAFLEQLVDYIAVNGLLEKPGMMYDPPFTNIHPDGPAGLFEPAEVRQIAEVIKSIKRNAQPMS